MKYLVVINPEENSQEDSLNNIKILSSIKFHFPESKISCINKVVHTDYNFNYDTLWKFLYFEQDFIRSFDRVFILSYGHVLTDGFCLEEHDSIICLNDKNYNLWSFDTIFLNKMFAADFHIKKVKDYKNIKRLGICEL